MSAPIRVVRIIARMNVGGPAQQITGLMAGLDPERYAQTLVVGDVGEDEEDWLALKAPALAEDPRLIRLPRLSRSISPRDDLAAGRTLRRLLSDLAPDLVHTHTAKAGLLGRRAAAAVGVPARVHTFHGHVLHGYFSPTVGRAVALLERRLARSTDALLAVGGRVRDELLQAGIGQPSQYTVVPPGVQPPAQWERQAARAQFGLDPATPVVAFVGRLAGVKRPDRMLAVAERLTTLQPGTVMLVAGGATPEELTALQAQVQTADVRWLGWVGDVGAVYAAADVVLLTSDNEGMPVSLIEAGMCGRPAVASEVGSVAEVVRDRHTGRVVPAEVGALADACAALLADPDTAARYGDAAAAHTHAAFSMDRLVATTASVYDRVVSRQDRP